VSKSIANRTRKSMRKVTIENTGKNLTTHAGLIPAMKFLAKLGFQDSFHHVVQHARSHNARYQLCDAVELHLLSLTAGARSVDESIRVWGDSVLRKLGGWQRMMDATTMGRIFKTVNEKHVYQMEVLNHVMRGRAWKRARAFTSRLIFRGDAGYFVGALLDWLDLRSDGYLIKVKLKGLVGLLEEKQWTPIAKHGNWEQTQFTHRCGTWTRTRTFVAVRRVKDEDSHQSKLLDLQAYDYFCYVTTENLTPWQTHKKYGERAICETWIDEAQESDGHGAYQIERFSGQRRIIPMRGSCL